MGILNSVRNFWGVLAVFAILWTHQSVAASVAEQAAVEVAPAQVVQQVTDEMMAVIKTGAKDLEEQPELYFSRLENILEKSVHFDYISRYVMGDYWDGATDEQRQLFNSRFKRSMVETIGKGLANYSDLKLSISPDDVVAKKNVAIVKQAVQGGSQPISISYWMARSKEGEWKLIDVVLEGVKLRETFRNQFKADMGQNSGDYATVITNWNNAVEVP